MPDWRHIGRRVAGAALRLALAGSLSAVVPGTAAAETVTRAFDCPEINERFELDLPAGSQPWIEGSAGVEFRLYWRPDGDWRQAEADLAVDFVSRRVIRVTIRDIVEFFWLSDTYLNIDSGAYLRIADHADQPGWVRSDGQCRVVIRG